MFRLGRLFRLNFISFVLLAVFFVARTAWASSDTASAGASHNHTKDTLTFMIDIVMVLIAAKLGGEVFERLKQPSVLGELLVGVLMGNLVLAGFPFFENLSSHQGIAIAAEIGVVLLLFQVGLESDVEELMKVGIASTLAAFAGVIAPMILGYVVGILILPDESPLVHLFLGATLSATSVGITARVMKDLGKTSTKEAKIILGAAVIDDVLGLIVLAIVAGLIKAAASGDAALSAGPVIAIVVKSIAFLAGSLIVGHYCAGPLMRQLARMKVHGIVLVSSICICFMLAALASLLGLAAIVGAFAAGLILDHSHYKPFAGREDLTVEQQIKPLADLFVPVFFVLMGLNVDLTAFTQTEALALAGALILAALVGKMVCGYVIPEKGINRLIVSVGMIPRGEVGLIFASIGAGLTLRGHRVISPESYSAIVIMVMVSTLIVPVWLKALYQTYDRKLAKS